MKLTLNGMIMGGGFGKWLREMKEDVILPEDISQAVEKANELGEDLEIDLSTPGGSVSDAGHMVANLAKLKGKSKVNIQGLVASAGTVLTSVFDEVTMSDFSYFLIHYPRQQFMGTLRPQELKEISNQLQAITEQSIDIYSKKTGLSHEVLEDYMSKETMFNAKQAKELGFVDKVVGQTTQSVAEAFKINPELVMRQSEDKLDQLYQKYNQGETLMSKELVENKVVEDVKPEAEPETTPEVTEPKEDEGEDEPEVKPEAKPEVKEAEPEAKPEDDKDAKISEMEAKLNKLMSTVDKLVEGLTPKTEVKATQVVEQKQEVVPEVIVKSVAEPTTMVHEPKLNPLGFDMTHYDI